MSWIATCHQGEQGSVKPLDCSERRLMPRARCFQQMFIISHSLLNFAISSCANKDFYGNRPNFTHFADGLWKKLPLPNQGLLKKKNQIRNKYSFLVENKKVFWAPTCRQETSSPRNSKANVLCFPTDVCLSFDWFHNWIRLRFLSSLPMPIKFLSCSFCNSPHRTSWLWHISCRAWLWESGQSD